MEDLVPWLTPAVMIGLFGWLRADIRNLRQEVNRRFDSFKQDVNQRVDDLKQDINKRFDEVDKRFDGVNRRFDEVNRELAGQRERMAKLEGSLEGFLAGRRDREAV